MAHFVPYSGGPSSVIPRWGTRTPDALSFPMSSEPLSAAFTGSDVTKRTRPYQSHWTQMGCARMDVPLPSYASHPERISIHFGSCHPHPPRRSSSPHVTRTASSHQCFTLFKRTLLLGSPVSLSNTKGGVVTKHAWVSQYTRRCVRAGEIQRATNPPREVAPLLLSTRANGHPRYEKSD